MSAIEVHRDELDDELKIQRFRNALHKPQMKVGRRMRRMVLNAKTPLNDPYYEQYVLNFRHMLDGLDCDIEDLVNYVFPVLYKVQSNHNPPSDIDMSVYGIVGFFTSACAFFAIPESVSNGWDAPIALSSALIGGSVAKFLGDLSDKLFPRIEMPIFPDLKLSISNGCAPRSFLKLDKLRDQFAELNLSTDGKSYAQLVVAYQDYKRGDMKRFSSPVSSGSSDNAGLISPQLEVFDSLSRQWRDWEMDILKVVQYPALFDMSVSETSRFHESLIFAERVKPDSGNFVKPDHPFVRALVEVEVAWKSAVDNAKRLKLSGFSKVEQKSLSTALSLLHIALDDSGSPDERQVSYKRAMKELDGLINVPDTALVEIESSGLRLELV